jgi:hypothetical protein
MAKSVVISDEMKRKQMAKDLLDKIFEEANPTTTVNGGCSALVNNPDFAMDCLELFRFYSKFRQHEGKEVVSDCTYPSTYKGSRDIDEQIDIISNFFGLNGADAKEYAKNLPVLPEGAEGWFAIAKVTSVAKKNFPAKTDPREQYIWSTNMSTKGMLCNSQEAMSKKFRQNPRTASFMKNLCEEQKGDILIVPAQFGFRYAGKSPYLAEEIYSESANEFGADLVAAACMTITHPERFSMKNSLNVDCPGSEFAPDEQGYTEIPALDFSSMGSLMKRGVKCAMKSKKDALSSRGIITLFASKK